MHELAGLTPPPGQDELSDLLAKTGTKADELLRKLPNLISDEGVSESHYSQEAANGCVGVGCIPQAGVATRDELFHYMILTHPAQNGRLAISEYRTTRHGKPVGQAAAGAPSVSGVHIRLGRILFRESSGIEVPVPGTTARSMGMRPMSLGSLKLRARWNPRERL